MDHDILLIVIGAIVVALLLAVLLLRGRRQHVSLGDTAPPPPAMRGAAPPPPAMREIAPIEEPAAFASPEEAEIITAAALGNAPVEAVAPAVAQEVPAAGDPLTRIKGLGPKAAARLGELGVTRYAQIAAWDEADVARVDGQLGAFKGRIARDRWVEQARLLAAGDREAFEAQFGKLGS